MSRNIPCTDHLGNTFPSIKDMCVYYNIAKNTFDNRIKKGCSLKEALTKHIQKKNKSCTDHLGNTFPTKSAMCEHYHITKSTFNSRIEKGCSLKEALTKHLQETNKSCTDHLGDTFLNVKNMCEHYNINNITFLYRIKTGYSIEESLGIIPIINFKTKSLQLTQSLFIKEVKSKNRKTLYAICIYNSIETLFTHDEIIEIYRNETRNPP